VEKINLVDPKNLVAVVGKCRQILAEKKGKQFLGAQEKV
jgi:hypothetical protein